MAIVEGLADGWEPEIESSDTIVLAAARAMADRAVGWASAAGGRVASSDGLVLVDVDSANLFANQALSLRPVDLDLGRRVVEFYPADRPLLLMCPRESADLRPLGLQLMGHPPLMVRPPSTGPAVPSGVRVVEVTDPAELGPLADVTAAGFGLPVTPVPASLLGGPHRFWLGYRGGELASVSAAYLGHGVVDVEMVATLEGHRGHGAGEAVTWAATLADPDRPAVLIASDLGRPIYQRMGYLPICRWTLWFRT